MALFAPEPRSADGHRYSCRSCKAETAKAWRQRTHATRLAKSRAYRLAHPDKMKAYGIKYRALFPWRTMVLHARKRAAKFGLAFDLDQHLPAIKRRVSKMRCEMSGTPLVVLPSGSQGMRHFNTPSIDRKDRTKGYTMDNIRIVCWAMNCALSTWGEEKLKTVMQGWLK